MDNPGLHLADCKHPLDIGGLVKMVGKHDQRHVLQLFQTQGCSAGQGVVLPDKQFQVAFPQQQVVIGLFRHMVGNAQGKINFLPVQQLV